MATRTFREKATTTTTRKPILSFDSIVMSSLPWITKKELEREIKTKGDQLRWKKTMEIIQRRARKCLFLEFYQT